MRALVQRVSSASVAVDDELISRIGPGMLVLLGIAVDDTRTEAEWIARKLRALRIFDDAEGRMNEPLGGREVLCVSQFTLLGEVSKGNRPSWGRAAPGEAARPLYETVCELLGAQQGLFGAHMEVDLVNDGPVTILVESPLSG
ncbi:MAG: D-tyrosyl-tRNA(Tyr) deacylase [Thermoleophilales bacterium]|nr:D-tyrosyl-tRNA(Tyr) deacylase [Thermoleophilales bacterium]